MDSGIGQEDGSELFLGEDQQAGGGKCPDCQRSRPPGQQRDFAEMSSCAYLSCNTGKITMMRFNDELDLAFGDDIKFGPDVSFAINKLSGGKYPFAGACGDPAQFRFGQSLKEIDLAQVIAGHVFDTDTDTDSDTDPDPDCVVPPFSVFASDTKTCRAHLLLNERAVFSASGSVSESIHE